MLWSIPTSPLCTSSDASNGGSPQFTVLRVQFDLQRYLHCRGGGSLPMIMRFIWIFNEPPFEACERVPTLQGSLVKVCVLWCSVSPCPAPPSPSPSSPLDPPCCCACSWRRVGCCPAHVRSWTAPTTSSRTSRCYDNRPRPSRCPRYRWACDRSRSSRCDPSCMWPWRPGPHRLLWWRWRTPLLYNLWTRNKISNQVQENWPLPKRAGSWDRLEGQDSINQSINQSRKNAAAVQLLCTWLHKQPQL